MTAAGEIAETLRGFVAAELLGEPEVADQLTDRAPLLEWGVLDSLNTARLLTYLRETFAVEIPLEDVVADRFRDIASIAALVEGRLAGGAGARATDPDAPTPARAAGDGRS